MKKIFLLIVLGVFAITTAQAQQTGNTVSKLTGWTISQETKDKFFQAVKAGKIGVVRKMVDDVLVAGTLTNAKDAKGNTPIMMAAEKGYLEIVKFLTENGGYVNSTNNNDWTALCFALKNRRPKTADYLLDVKARADISCGKEGDRTTPLVLATDTNANPQLIERLASKADVNVRDGKGFTPLMRAAEAGNVKSVEILLKAGADMNMEIPSYKGAGKPVAFFPIYSGELDTLKYLLERGAKLHGFFENGAYVTPHEVARSNGGAEMVKYLESKGFTEDGFVDQYWD